MRIGGIVSRAGHPGAKNGKLGGGPQMVEVSRDGRQVYFTNALYGAIDPLWMPKIGITPEAAVYEWKRRLGAYLHVRRPAADQFIGSALNPADRINGIHTCIIPRDINLGQA